MPCSSMAYWTNGIGAVSERNGVTGQREPSCAPLNASLMPSPQVSASPPWWTSSRTTRVRPPSVIRLWTSGSMPTWA